MKQGGHLSQTIKCAIPENMIVHLDKTVSTLTCLIIVARQLQFGKIPSHNVHFKVHFLSFL